jgi:hypothetical protein
VIRTPELLPALRSTLAAGLVLSGCGAGVQGPRPVSADAANEHPAAAEWLGGHTHARHVGRSDDELREMQKRAEERRRLSVNTPNWTVADIVSLLKRDFGGA